jgi:hypothetical protein
LSAVNLWRRIIQEIEKNSNTRSYRFSANDASQVQLSNKSSVLATYALEIDKQIPVLLKHKDRELKSFTVKTEKNKNKMKALLLGSSRGREIGPMSQENLGTKFDICSIFKPNAPLAKAAEDIKNFNKDLTMQDHIMVGRPANSLERNHHYSIENDLNFVSYIYIYIYLY